MPRACRSTTCAQASALAARLTSTGPAASCRCPHRPSRTRAVPRRAADSRGHNPGRAAATRPATVAGTAHECPGRACQGWLCRIGPGPGGAGRKREHGCHPKQGRGKLHGMRPTGAGSPWSGSA
jgi:hypothetical protein